MKKCIFSLGLFDKKLIWTLLYTIIMILRDLVNYQFLKDKHHEQFSNIGGPIGQILIIIIPCLPCFKNQKQSDEKKCTKKNFLFFFLLIFFHSIFIITVVINSAMNRISNNHHDSYFCSKEGIELIIIFFSTFLFLKYKYFLHHIISLIIFCLTGVGIDFLLDNFNENPLGKNYIEIILYFVIIILEILNYTYQKYMMDKLYYHYWNLSLALGLSLFVITLGLVLIPIIKKDEKSINLYRELKPGYIILGFFLNIIIGFFQYLSRILILDYFTPNHMLIAYELLKVYYVLTKSPSPNKWYSIILFVFKFLILMFYLEIFEFNFCNLNENTKKNIMSRAGLEELIDNGKRTRNITIELETGYIINESKSRKSNELEILNNESDESSNRTSQSN